MIKITFRSCIKRSISKSVGCKLPWDKTTSGFDTCEDIHQFRYIPMRLDNSSSRFFRDFSKRYLALSYLVPGQLEEITGCRLPCAYKEFRFFGSPRVRSRNVIFADSAQTGYCSTFPCVSVRHRRDISSFLDNLIV